MPEPQTTNNGTPGTPSWFRRQLRLWIIALLSLLLGALAGYLAGCQTYARVDWHTWTTELRDNQPWDVPTTRPAP